MAHAVEAQMAQRNLDEMNRQLAGRRSRAALEWLLKRQEERTQHEHEVYRPRRGAGHLAHSRTSPNNPLCTHQEEQQRMPSPADMAMALAQMRLEAASPVAAHPACGSRPTTPTAADALAASGVNPCLASTAGSICAEAGCGEAGEAAGVCHLEDGDDAVAVIADDEGAVAPHLLSHLSTGSLAPSTHEPAANTIMTPALTATRAAYWRQQELDDLMSSLLAQYPHGIPRKMTMDLRQLGIHDIPSLGFGCPSSSLTHDTMLLSKEI